MNDQYLDECIAVAKAAAEKIEALKASALTNRKSARQIRSLRGALTFFRFVCANKSDFAARAKSIPILNKFLAGKL